MNLIKYFIIKTKYNVISLDDYSSGSKINHINNRRVRYLKGIQKILINFLINISQKLMPFFILENFQEFIKAFPK